MINLNNTFYEEEEMQDIMIEFLPNQKNYNKNCTDQLSCLRFQSNAIENSFVHLLIGSSD